MNRELERAVQWYPGHMVAAMRKMAGYLKLIDIVIEVVDARVPRSGANPMLDALVGARPRLTILNHEDGADPHLTRAWIEWYAARGRDAMPAVGREQQSVTRIAREISMLAGKASKTGTKRAIVIGLPNSGKSSIINGLLKRAAAKTEDRAGVTRQLQWFKLAPGVELMDTPGILVPKIDTSSAQWKLALCSAVPRDRYDPEEVATAFHAWAQREGKTAVPSLQEFAAARGFMRKGGEADYHNAAQSYIRAFNDGTFGRITLEVPDDPEAA